MDRIITLEDVKKEVFSNIESGITCPCCGQFAKMYKRTINNSSLIALKIVADRTPRNSFIHVGNFLNDMKLPKPVKSTGDFAKLRFWGLIEEQPNEEPKKRNSGYWKISQLGYYFLEGWASVQKYVYLYDGKPVNVAGNTEEIYFSDVKAVNFDYQKLMENE